MARTILCIDDDQSTFETLGEALDAGAYRILRTDDPEEGFRLVREEEPDLVLLEILLPRGNGLDLVERIRSEGGDASDVPIVVVTSSERTPQLYGRALELGVLDFISKPVLDSQILEAVRELASKPKSEVDLHPEEEARGVPETFPRSGDLGELAFPELLHRLHAAGASGVLIVEAEGNRIGVQLRNGSPVVVSAGRPRESIEDFLLRSGRIAADEHERLSEQLALGLGSPGEILAGMDILSEEEYQKAIRAQAEERLFELFHWGEGTYRFQAGKRLNASSAFELGSGAESIILRGILEHAPIQRIREALESRATLYVEERISQTYQLDELGLSSEQRQLLSDAQGDRPLSAFFGPEEQRLRLLYAFVVMELLELSVEPVLVLVDALDDEAADAGEKGGGEAKAHPAAEPDPHRGATRPAAVETGLESCREQEERPAAEEIASRALSAEKWFRNGERLLDGKKYQESLEAFGMAVHLDPEEGEYLSHLGWALYLSNPTDALIRREALEHIAKAIKLSPDRELSYLYLGRIFKATDELRMARKMFARALKIRPDCHPAMQELRLLELRALKSRRGKGVLRRLRGG